MTKHRPFLIIPRPAVHLLPGVYHRNHWLARFRRNCPNPPRKSSSGISTKSGGSAVVKAEDIIVDPPAGAAGQGHQHERLAVLERGLVALLIHHQVAADVHKDTAICGWMTVRRCDLVLDLLKRQRRQLRHDRVTPCHLRALEGQHRLGLVQVGERRAV